MTFASQKVPHKRHVTEFGAVCTACHSAEVHKAVTAKPATCTGCHHAAQNDRCDSCHKVQADLYRGETKTTLAKVEPNVMAAAVPCTGCHDWSRKHSRLAVGQKCVGCHDASYKSFVAEWTTGLDKQAARAADALKRAEAAIGAARRNGRATGAEPLVKEAREGLALVRRARAVHNPAVAEAILDAVEKKVREALGRTAAR